MNVESRVHCETCAETWDADEPWPEGHTAAHEAIYFNVATSSGVSDAE